MRSTRRLLPITVGALATVMTACGLLDDDADGGPSPSEAAAALRQTLADVYVAADPSGIAPEIPSNGLGSCGGASGLDPSHASTWLTVHGPTRVTAANAAQIGDAVVAAFESAGWEVARDAVNSDIDQRTINVEGPDDSHATIEVRPGGVISIDAKTGCFPR